MRCCFDTCTVRRRFQIFKYSIPTILEVRERKLIKGKRLQERDTLTKTLRPQNVTGGKYLENVSMAVNALKGPISDPFLGLHF